MRINKVSGAPWTRIPEDELNQMIETGQTIKRLKQRLSDEIGYSRFRQRLLADTGELHDDMPLMQWPELQLVVLDFCPSDSSMDTQFFSACSKDRPTDVEQMLREGPHDPNRTDRYSNSGLWMAADGGHLEVVRLLLEAGADTDAGTHGWTALSMATQNNHFEVVALLIEAKANLEVRTRGLTPLRLAASKGHLEIARLLVEAGANKETTESGGWTALHWAAESGHAEVVDLLVKAGAKKEAKHPGGMTPLLLAARNGHFQVVQLLLELGADTDATCPNGLPALLLAAQFGHLEVLQLLVEAGASPEAQRPDGLTALQFAALHGHLSVVQFFLQTGTLEAQQCESALLLATQLGDERAVRAFLRAGGTGGKALRWAAGAGRLDMVQLFMDSAGESVPGAWWALAWAAVRGHRAVVRFLGKRLLGRLGLGL